MDIPVSNKIKVMDRLKTDYDKLKKPNESMENDNYKVQIQINKINKLIEKYNLNKIFGLNESKRDQIIDIESIQDLETVNIKLENYIDKGCYDQARKYIDNIYNNYYDKTNKVFDIIEHLNEIYRNSRKRYQLLKSRNGIKYYHEIFVFIENYDRINNNTIKLKGDDNLDEDYKRMNDIIKTANEKMEELKSLL